MRRVNEIRAVVCVRRNSVSDARRRTLFLMVESGTEVQMRRAQIIISFGHLIPLRYTCFQWN